MRPRWNKQNTDYLYDIYFPILYNQSTLEYLELINFEEIYNQSLYSYYNNK